MFIEKLEALMKENGVTQKALVEKCEIGKNQFAYWKKHGNVPAGAILEKIASFFNVSVDYLLGKTDDRGGSADIGLALSEEQLALLMEIKSLPEDQQKEAWDYIQYLKSKRQ